MKIIRLNLPRHQTRRDFGNGALFALGVPYANILVWEGIDDLRYEQTYRIFEDAIRDGFSHFQILLDCFYDGWVPIAYVAQHWNLCRIFRYISEEYRKPIILLQDDMVLTRTYETYLGFYKYVKNVARRCRVDLKYVALTDNDNPAYMLSEVRPIPRKNILHDGILSNGIDLASMITPKGAKWILETWSHQAYRHKFRPTLETAFMEFVEAGVNLSGVYTTLLEFVRLMPEEISASTIHKNGSFSEYLRPIETTRREKPS